MLVVFTAWPNGMSESINRGPFHGDAGSTVRLDCSITPGVLVDQYYVTWRSASDRNLIFYQSFPPFLNFDVNNRDSQRYLVDPGNFSLSIRNVTPADGAHDYVCVLGVQDTHEDLQFMNLIYIRTQSVNLSVSISSKSLCPM